MLIKIHIPMQNNCGWKTSAVLSSYNECGQDLKLTPVLHLTFCCSDHRYDFGLIHNLGPLTTYK